VRGDFMDCVILIKYGELSTKKANRNFFIKTLYDNLKKKLSDYEVKINKDRARMYIEFLEKDLDDIKNIVSKVFGIHTYHIAYIVDTDDKTIQDKVLSTVKEEEFKTFKIETRRSNKSFPIHSQDYNRVLGGLILKNIDGVSVDVHNPDLWITVEIRDTNTFIYFNSYKGSGGYPVGTQPKGMLMLSGGIDSPVAGYLALKRGMTLDAVYFEAMPHTSIEARNKVISLSKKLACYTDHINLHIVNFTPIQEEIYKNCREDYMITIMRRMMYRIMEKMVKKYKGLVIVNGESIGQVASQTLTSMNVINSVTNIPVIRPLACFDKLEIMDIARNIDTYDISIIPYEDCCTVFVPKHPVINPKLGTCIEEENKFDYESMLDKAVETINTIVITDKEENKFSDLL
jgi:thiamine biosynthesis protein ThiI